MSHFEERLQADLESIRDWVWDMGEDVQAALRNAKQALLTRDSDLAFTTVLQDNPINRKSRACDRKCHSFIARHLPGAGHLREMAATIRVNVALERVGDYAVTICREALQIDQDLPEIFILQMDLLADEVFQILHESRVTFRDDQAESALTLMKMAKRVEDRMDSIYDTLFKGQHGLSARTALAVFVVFNLLKRVADQAKNVCDQTVYAVRGVAKVPKVYQILFVSPPASPMAQLATAVGRKAFPTAARFVPAVAGDSQPPGPALAQFIEQTGLPDEDLTSRSLRGIAHDLSEFDVMIALGCRYQDVIGRVPFHTSAFNWSMPDQNDLSEAYRFLRSEIEHLLDVLAGDEAA